MCFPSPEGEQNIISHVNYFCLLVNREGSIFLQCILSQWECLNLFIGFLTSSLLAIPTTHSSVSVCSENDFKTSWNPLKPWHFLFSFLSFMLYFQFVTKSYFSGSQIYIWHIYVCMYILPLLLSASITPIYSIPKLHFRHCFENEDSSKRWSWKHRQSPCVKHCDS